MVASRRQAGPRLDDKIPSRNLEQVAVETRDTSLRTHAGAAFGLSIVIVTYNSASVLPGLLDSLPAGLEGVKQSETIVVDNDSADDSVDIALAHAIRPR